MWKHLPARCRVRLTPCSQSSVWPAALSRSDGRLRESDLENPFKSIIILLVNTPTAGSESACGLRHTVGCGLRQKPLITGDQCVQTGDHAGQESCCGAGWYQANFAVGEADIVGTMPLERDKTVDIDDHMGPRYYHRLNHRHRQMQTTSLTSVRSHCV